MNISGLSFDALPPINLPFRFFLTAPLFAFICAGILLFYGESVWLSRWQAPMLALTHGFTLGMVSMIMMGALLQMMPVVGGIGFPKVEMVAKTSHFLIVLGIFTLMLSFLFPHAQLIVLAVVMLFLGYGIFLVAIGWALLQKRSEGPTIVVIRWAIFFVFIVVALGLLLQLRRIGFEAISHDKFYTNLHAIMGAFGWMGLLIVAVSFQVIPMFHVAPSFPAIVMKYLPRISIVLLALAACSKLLVSQLSSQEFNQELPELLSFLTLFLLVASCLFSIVFLKVLAKRKRKIPDITVRYWQFAALSMLCILLLFIAFDFILSESVYYLKTLLLAALFLYGYVVSIIQGLLIKILPFLSYTHLQQLCLKDFNAMQHLPNMHDFLNKAHSAKLFYLHVISTILIAITVIFPSTFYLFTLAFTIEFLWLFYLMIKVVRRYHLTLVKMNTELGADDLSGFK